MDEWIDLHQASAFLSEKFGRPIGVGTVQNLAHPAKPSEKQDIRPPVIRTKDLRPGDRRVKLYSRVDLESLDLKPRKTRAEMDAEKAKKRRKKAIKR